MQVHCTVYSARRTSTTAVGHATHVRRTSTTLALKGLTNQRTVPLTSKLSRELTSFIDVAI